MRLFEGHLSRPFLWSALLAVLMLCGGCQTATRFLFTATGPGWHVQEGQALWQPGREIEKLPTPKHAADASPQPGHRLPEFGGDIVVATHEDGRCFIQFSKTPMTLLSVETTRTNWLVQFPMVRMSFTGRGAPPVRFAWLFLHAALAGEQLPSPLRFERKPDGGWRLENTSSGETLEGFLTP